MAPFSFRRRSNRSATSTRATTPATTAPSSPNTASSPNFATAPAQRPPEAIPCPDYYDMFPEDAGPLGHVVIRSHDDMRVWRLTAKPISAEDALKQGGCLQYIADGENSEEAPTYYTFAHDATEVYGSATYHKAVPESPVGNGCVAAKEFPIEKHVDAQPTEGATAATKAKTKTTRTRVG